MNYYNEIKNKLIDNEIYLKVKDYSKERHTLITHYEVGKLLLEAGRIYGEDIIGSYSKKLTIEVGKKYNPRTLRRMRQLYLFFQKQKWSPLGTKLSISHVRELFCLNNNLEINYYANQVSKRNLSKRELETIIKNKEYQRIPEDTKNKITNNIESDVVDFVKNPIKIKNNSNYKVISEKILQKLILEDISSFLKELGNGFTFIENEYKIKLGDRYNYIDLLLYNIKFKCYVVVELKVTELNSNHTGQIQKYMNYVDKNIKTLEENKTIGIIICKQDNTYVIKYCSDDRIIAREYELI